MTSTLLQSSYHGNLTLRNFTCFQEQSIDFVEGVNVFVGENGTGKTHAMKALYAHQKTQASLKSATIQEELARLFQIENLNELIAKGAARGALAVVSGTYNGQDWEYRIQRGQPQGIAADKIVKPRPEMPIFIPTIDYDRAQQRVFGIVELC